MPVRAGVPMVRVVDGSTRQRANVGLRRPPPLINVFRVSRRISVWAHGFDAHQLHNRMRLARLSHGVISVQAPTAGNPIDDVCQAGRSEPDARHQ
jgi:hypothetical protein